MKPSHYLKNQILVVEMPETYEFQEAWAYFQEELPKTEEFEEASFCIVDGSQFKYLGSLGMSSEIILFGQKFLASGGHDFLLSGFSEEVINVLKLLVDGKVKLPSNHDSLDSAFHAIEQSSKFDIY